MKFVLKFKNGDVVSVPDFDKFQRKIIGTDFVGGLTEVREKDLPIELNGDNGTHYKSTGKELVSVELILE